MTMTYSGLVRTAVTKSGHLAVSLAEYTASVLSITDGSVISEFTHEGNKIAVDLEGRIWTWYLFSDEVSCFSVEGKILHKLSVQFQPRSLAFLSDGRLVFGGEGALHFYSADCEKIQSVEIHDNIYDVKTCRDEIYVLRKHHISIFSSEGVPQRDICPNLIAPNFISLVGHTHILICQYGSRPVSVWTNDGTFVCTTSFDPRTYHIDVLPHGKVAVCAAINQNERNPNFLIFFIVHLKKKKGMMIYSPTYGRVEKVWWDDRDRLHVRIYIAPTDEHTIHAPVTGELVNMKTEAMDAVRRGFRAVEHASAVD